MTSPSLQELIEKAHAQSVKSGFWNHDAGCPKAPGNISIAEERSLIAGSPCQCKNLDLAMKRSLIHAEVSEALEELRLTDEKRGGPLGAILYQCVVLDPAQGHERDALIQTRPARFHSDGVTTPACCSKPAKPEGFIIELADAAIRLFDLCGQLGWPLTRAPALTALPQPRLDHYTWGQVIEALHDGVTGLQLNQLGATHNELLTLLEYAALRAGGYFWTAIDVKMAFNATREHMHGKTC